jgi:hypothetical protein
LPEITPIGPKDIEQKNEPPVLGSVQLCGTTVSQGAPVSWLAGKLGQREIPRSSFALQCFNSSFQFINTESPPLYRTPPQEGENSYYNNQDRQHQSRRPLIKLGHGNLLSVRLNAELKGDYSQPRLMPSRYLEQMDLPSAYLVPVPSLSLLSAELSSAKAHSRYSGLPQREPATQPYCSRMGRDCWGGGVRGP